MQENLFAIQLLIQIFGTELAVDIFKIPEYSL